MDQTNQSISMFLILIIIIIVGIAGNILNLIVFGQKTMRNHTTFQYLFYLSIVDLLVLTTCASDSMLTYGFFLMIRLKSEIACRLHTFLTYFFTHMSSTILMLVSIDRAFVITNKKSFLSIFKRDGKNDRNNANSIFKIKSISKIIFVTTIILFLINLHYLIFLDLNEIDDFDELDKIKDRFINQNNSKTKILEIKILKNFVIKLNDSKLPVISFSNRNMMMMTNVRNGNDSSPIYICYPFPNTIYFYFIENIWIVIDMLIYSLMPFIVMIFFSFIIIDYIRKTSKSFLKNKNKDDINLKIVTKSKQRNRQMLLMLTVTNLYFIICSLPLCINIILNNIINSKNSNSIYHIAFQTLSYSNNSMNFIFYILFSKKYRSVASRLIFLKSFNKPNSNNLIACDYSIVNRQSFKHQTLSCPIKTKEELNRDKDNSAIPSDSESIDV